MVGECFLSSVHILYTNISKDTQVQLRHVLIHNIGQSIPLLRMPKPTQGRRADDDGSDYCEQIVGKTIDVECTGIFVELLKLM